MEITPRKTALIAAGVLATLAGAALVWQLRSVVVLFVVSIALAASIRPLADGMARRKWLSGVSAALLALLLVTGILTILGLTGYVLADELPRATIDLRVRYAAFQASMREGPTWQQSIAARMPTVGEAEEMIAATVGETEPQAPPEPSAPPTPSASAADAPSSEQTATPATTTPAAAAPETENAPSANEDAPAENASVRRASGLLRLFASATNNIGEFLAQVALLVALSLYWVLDHEWFERLWVSLIAADKRTQARATWRNVEDRVGAHVRSELFQALVAGVLLFVGFAVMGMPYPLLLAWACALAWLVPLLGWVIAAAPVLLIGLISGPWMSAAGLIYLTLVFALMEFVVEPRVDVRRRAGSILGLIVAMIMLDTFGLIGLLFASPLAVAIEVTLDQLMAPAPPKPEQDSAGLEALEQRMVMLRAAMGRADVEIPASTRSLYDRLQELIIDAEQAL